MLMKNNYKTLLLKDNDKVIDSYKCEYLNHFRISSFGYIILFYYLQNIYTCVKFYFILINYFQRSQCWTIIKQTIFNRKRIKIIKYNYKDSNRITFENK